MTIRIGRRMIIAAAVLTLGLAVFFLSDAHRYLNFETIRQNREALLAFVRARYAAAVVLFCALYLSTAFFVPGALVLTVLGGFLFGFLPGALYANLSASAGAGLAFIASRYFVGSLIQRRYAPQLLRFNREVERHGTSYLLALRIVPVLPFFVVNYLAGLTKISLPRFLATTLAGMLPGSLVYSFAGRQLGTIARPEDILSTGVIVAFLLLAVLALLPVIVSVVRRLRFR